MYHEPPPAQFTPNTFAPRIALIGGTGVGHLLMDTEPEVHTVPTHWGTAEFQRGTLQGVPLIFLPRHGPGHRLPPHHIPYRANIAALRQIGIRAVFATTAVGSLRTDLLPGTFVVLDDLIDFTLARTGKTFFDEPGIVAHADCTALYSPPLRAILADRLTHLQLPFQGGGTYLCADGPRYETRAEVRLFASWGADVVGMTGVPEATLAREAGLHYAGVSVVTNLGAGLTTGELTHADVEATMQATMESLRTVLAQVVLSAQAIVDSLSPVGPELVSEISSRLFPTFAL